MTSTTITWNPAGPAGLSDLAALSGTTAVVTGGSTGVGRAVTDRLAHAGARVLIGARDLPRARAVAESLNASLTGLPGTVEAAALDLADPESVRAFAAWVESRTDGLGLLVNNAGISNQPFLLTPAGVEQQFAINHLGHYALTGLLLPLLTAPGEAADSREATGGSREAIGGNREARVITVSSLLHHQVPLDLSLLADEATYSPGAAYVRSKLANVLFSTELDRRLRRAGSQVRALLAHPGLARTSMHDTYPDPETTRMVRAALAESGRDPEDAITGILYAATSPNPRGDALYGPGGTPDDPHITADPLQGQAEDTELAAALWKHSAALSGVHYLDGDADKV